MPIGWLPVRYKDYTFAWQNRGLAAKNKLLLLQPVLHPGDTSLQEKLVKGREERKAMTSL